MSKSAIHDLRRSLPLTYTPKCRVINQTNGNDSDAGGVSLNRQYRGEAFELPAECNANFSGGAANTLTAKLLLHSGNRSTPKNQRCLDIGCGVSF